VFHFVIITHPPFLFFFCIRRNASWLSRLKTIARATKQHATNLAKFVTVYKSLLLVQRKLNGGKARPHDTFFAGLLGGYLVFGERNAINEQVCIPRLNSDFPPHPRTPDPFLSSPPTPAPSRPCGCVAAVHARAHVSFSSSLCQISNASPVTIVLLDRLIRRLPCGRLVNTQSGFAIWPGSDGRW
jgi:hypothetical protein